MDAGTGTYEWGFRVVIDDGRKYPQGPFFFIGGFVSICNRGSIHFARLATQWFVGVFVCHEIVLCYAAPLDYSPRVVVPVRILALNVGSTNGKKNSLPGHISRVSTHLSALFLQFSFKSYALVVVRELGEVVTRQVHLVNIVLCEHQRLRRSRC